MMLIQKKESNQKKQCKTLQHPFGKKSTRINWEQSNKPFFLLLVKLPLIPSVILRLELPTGLKIYLLNPLYPLGNLSLSISLSLPHLALFLLPLSLSLSPFPYPSVPSSLPPFYSYLRCFLLSSLPSLLSPSLPPTFPFNSSSSSPFISLLPFAHTFLLFSPPTPFCLPPSPPSHCPLLNPSLTTSNLKWI